MRVLVAPDKFAGTLTAVEAAEAIAAGWRRRAPDDELDLAPMADGGPGFVDVLHAALGGELLAVTVAGPLGEPAPATVLRRRRHGVRRERAGLRPAPDRERGRRGRTTYGVGELLAAAVEAGARRGGRRARRRGTNDGGAGLLAALGATADVPPRRGRRRPGGLTAVDLARGPGAGRGVRLVAASDVDNPLLGLLGATKVFGPQKGVAEERLPAGRRLLEHSPARPTAAALEKGAGAAGGLGFALLAARRRAGSPASSSSSRRSAWPAGAARRTWWSPARAPSTSPAAAARCRTASPTVAAEALRPCVVLAGQVLVGSREMRALGVESAYSVVDQAGEEGALRRARRPPARARRARRAEVVALSGRATRVGRSGRE